MKYSKIYIEKEIQTHPQALKIVSQSNTKIEIVQDTEKLFKKISNAADPIEKGKKILLLSKNKGPFLKKCPGTKKYSTLQAFAQWTAHTAYYRLISIRL